MSSLPTLSVQMTPEQVLACLDKASRKGRLAGFGRGTGEILCIVDAWGTPFDGELRVQSAEAAQGLELRFHVAMRRKMPIVFGVVLALTVWPGVMLTDSMLKLWFDWYYTWTQIELFQIAGFDALTYLWYLPLTLFPLPWIWRSLMARSRATMEVSAHEMIGKIAMELGVPNPLETQLAAGGASPAE